jgi:hypothetical protein
MTNPHLISPWLSIINECEVQLTGIWTLPVISEKLLKIIKATSGIVLLVSQQVNSNIRQSLFRDGKLLTSRQSIINHNIKDAVPLEKLVAPEIKRTLDFLRIQNLVGADEKIHLHILGAEGQLQSLQQSFEEMYEQSVITHSIADVHKKTGISGVTDRFSDNIFSWLCLQQNSLTGHYGPGRMFNRYHNKLMATALYAASLTVLIAGVLLTEANISGAMEYERSIALLKKEEASYRSLYTEKFKDFEEVFQNAGVMNSAVMLAERIKLNASTSPLEFMISLSDILARDRTGGITIEKIEWQAVNIDQQNRTVTKANFTDKQPVKHNAIVTGRIDVPKSNYRDSINHIQKIITRLESDERVESVETLVHPVDLRPESQFSTESGVAVNTRKNEESGGIFSFRITMKEPDHV